MAQQTCMTNFFNSRKRGADIHASKRRKVQRLVDAEETTTEVSSEPLIENITEKKTKAVELKEVSKARQRTVRATRASGRSSRAKAKTGGQDIKQFLSGILQKDEGEALPETTSACDDHQASPPCTPTKHSIADIPSTGQKRSRKDKVIRKDLFGVKTPEPYNFTEFTEKSPKPAERLVMKGQRLSDEVNMTLKHRNNSNSSI